MSNFDHLIAGRTSISAKIRALHEAGVAGKEIANFLGVKENHVYSTISRDRARKKNANVSDCNDVNVADKTRAAGDRPALDDEEVVMVASVNEQGELVLSPQVTQALGLANKEQVVVFVRPGDLRLMSRAKAVERLQESVRRAAPAEAALASALLKVDADTRK
ncbi:hypothetical protein [Phenylobacterium sp. NIBR 498073]|uniref:hypothetical protein n=1 Tax=Phenylobacterium sp. NIBR 498073 TaxID=3015177 RepID=UPI0022B49BAC|nr:hypothetical protein [Phenylobacterium sp. NIBR 498073]WGU40955.1 hypothetical protein O4N75_04325 [Phenylobacterium sp. NIBR 498073]